MKPTNGNVFLDSNICIYLFDKDSKKSSIAFSLLAQSPVISTQVIAEDTNVLIKKLKFPKQIAFDSAMFIMNKAMLRI